MKEKKQLCEPPGGNTMNKMDKTMAQVYYHRYIHMNGNCLSILTDLQYRRLKIRFFVKHIYDC